MCTTASGTAGGDEEEKEKGEIEEAESRADGDGQVCSSTVRRESMKVEHFAICRYLSLLAQRESPAPSHHAGQVIKDTLGALPDVRGNATYSRPHPPALPAQESISNSSAGITIKRDKRLVLEPLPYTHQHERRQEQEQEHAPSAAGRTGQSASTSVLCSAAAAWKARGPGAWVHALIRPAFADVPSAPSARGGGGGSGGDVDHDGRQLSHAATPRPVCTAPRTWLGSHCEGSVWLALLMMLMYEEIYDTALPLGE